MEMSNFSKEDINQTYLRESETNYLNCQNSCKYLSHGNSMVFAKCTQQSFKPGDEMVIKYCIKSLCTYNAPSVVVEIEAFINGILRERKKHSRIFLSFVGGLKIISALKLILYVTFCIYIVCNF